MHANNNIIDSVDVSGAVSYCYLYNYLGYYGGDSTECKNNNITNIQLTNGSNYCYFYNYLGYGYYAPNAYFVRNNLVKNVNGNYAYIYNFAYYARFVDSNSFINMNLGVGTTPSAAVPYIIIWATMWLIMARLQITFLETFLLWVNQCILMEAIMELLIIT